MNPLLVIAITLVLVIVGITLNGIELKFDHLANSPEQHPGNKLEAERQTYRKFFDLMRTRSLKRQKRIGRYAWLILIAFITSHLWTYFDTVNRTRAWNQIAALQTVATEEGKEMVLLVTLSDGSDEKYRIKLTKADTGNASTTQGISKETISSRELSNAKTALSIGDNPLPLGVALKISNWRVSKAGPTPGRNTKGRAPHLRLHTDFDIFSNRALYSRELLQRFWNDTVEHLTGVRIWNVDLGKLTTNLIRDFCLTTSFALTFRTGFRAE
jgi:hypothetical protein